MTARDGNGVVYLPCDNIRVGDSIVEFGLVDSIVDDGDGVTTRFLSQSGLRSIVFERDRTVPIWGPVTRDRYEWPRTVDRELVEKFAVVVEKAAVEAGILPDNPTGDAVIALTQGPFPHLRPEGFDLSDPDVRAFLAEKDYTGR